MYNWKRFFCQPDHGFSLSDNGFLFDPESEHGNSVNPHVLNYDQLQGNKCVVILGEPGIGKSAALVNATEVAKKNQTSRDRIIAVDLGDYGSETSLVADVFGLPEVSVQSDQAGEVTLFLDSLDECKIKVSHVARVLKRELAKLERVAERISLRIGCRTADWPASLTEFFGEIWGEEDVAVTEVVPLRRSDVIEAATQSGIDAERFLKRVIELNCQPLAIKPITLKFLIKIFNNGGDLKTNPVELYEEGCLLLCKETNTNRIESNETGNLSADQRLQLASRIAAVSIFCNRPIVSRGGSSTVRTAEEIAISELAGFKESCRGNEFDVTEHGIEEVLGTGLFSSRGSNCFGFAHQTYAEFLAARYLRTKELRTAEIQKLIFSSESNGGSVRIFPQLIETAAWVANQNKDVFDTASKCDPLALIKSDVAKASEPDRKKLVLHLLELFSQGEIAESGWTARSQYSKLNHAGLGELLIPYIEEKSLSDDTRTFAIHLAQACQLSVVQSSLVRVALDNNEPYYVRCQAARAIVAIGNVESRELLKPLVQNPAIQDFDLTLSTIVLRSLWPEFIDGKELFDLLQVPQQNTIGGSYGYFLSHELSETLTDDDLPFAIRWVAGLTQSQSSEFSVRDLVAEIAMRGWMKLDHPGVLEAMVAYCLARLKFHCQFVSKSEERFEDCEVKRRSLVERIVPGIADSDTSCFSLVVDSPELVRTSDAVWMLQKLESESRREIREHWAKLVSYVADLSDAKQLKAIKDCVESSAELKKELGLRLEALDPTSKEAARRRKIQEKHRARMKEDEKLRNPPPLDPPPAVRIAGLIEVCEQGEIEAWFDLTSDMQLEDDSTHYLKDLEEDITTLPGWQKRPPEARNRIIGIATKFLELQKCRAPEYFDKNSSPIWDRAGYKALVLLLKESVDQFNKLSKNAWDNWAASIVDHHGSPAKSDEHKKQFDKVIAERCLENSLEIVADSIKAIVRGNLNSAEVIILPQIIHRTWNEGIRATLFELANDRDLNSKLILVLLDTLLEHGCKETERFAGSLLPSPPPKNEKERGLASAAAQSLLRHADDAGWPKVWPTLKDDVELGRDIIEGVAEKDFHNCRVASKINEEQLADLYVWLTKQYPHSTDPPHSSGFVGTRRSAASYRDDILRALQHRGTVSAITALNRIRSELPELDWIHRVIVSAKRMASRESWKPVSVAGLLALTQTTDSTLVQNEAELQTAVVQSLNRLQVKLQAETPAAPDLWDTSVGRPKDENHFSDYVKRHLESDLRSRGIVSLREVEIRRGEANADGTGKGQGERTDIHVTGVVPGVIPGSFDQVRVIVEAKGSWHNEVDSAMETQLVGRYLDGNDCTHGIYLVGWYHCDQWDKKDGRYKSSRKETFAEYKARFQAQADSLPKSPNVTPVVLDCSLR